MVGLSRALLASFRKSLASDSLDVDQIYLSTCGTNRMEMLVPDDQFPDIELDIAGGGSVSLPGDVAGHWTYVLFYRGGW